MSDILKVISVAANPSVVIADPAKDDHSSSLSTKEICVKSKMVQSRHNISLLKLVFVLMLFLDARAQCIDDNHPNGLSWDFDEGNSEGFSINTVCSEFFIPQIIIDTKHIRQYILDERFQVLRNQYGDMRTIDAIYLKSLEIADYNIARALFLSFLAVLEHHTVDFKMPIVSPLKVPLTFENDSVFFARLKHLPTHVYSDSPTDQEGDRDKLQHFFGSAYLSYTSEAPQFATAIGNFIEWGEPIFVVGGTDDPRDKYANKQGDAFGRDLLFVKTLLPSDYLTFQHKIMLRMK